MKKGIGRPGRPTAMLSIMLIIAFSQLVSYTHGIDVELKDAEANGSWLMLVYMAADNSLGYDDPKYGNAAVLDIEEMESSFPDTGLEILVLSDLYGDHNTRLYDIEHHPGPGIGSPTIPLTDVNPSWTVDELDMSDWRVLRDFTTYSLSTKSADNIMMVIWDHGTGWYSMETTPGSGLPVRGFAHDNGRWMGLDGLRSAFVESEGSLGELFFDIIAFDTCYMGSLESHYQVARWGGYGIGSEDQQPWYGYNYTFVTDMGGSDPLPPPELCSRIVELFKDTYPGQTYATISVVDLTIMGEDFIAAWNDLSREILGRMYYFEVQNDDMFRDPGVRAERTRHYSFCDVGDLLGELSEAGIHTNVTRRSDQALTLYNEMIVDEYHSTVENPGATGVSVFFPLSKTNQEKRYDGSAGLLDLTADSLWDELIREFQDPLERVRLDLEATSMEGDGVADDLVILLTDPTSGNESLPGSPIFLNDVQAGETDEDGSLVIGNLSAGRYTVEGYHGIYSAISDIKVLNRPPVPVCSPLDPVVGEGESIRLDAGLSYDPDGDDIEVFWDLDSTDGLDDVNYTGLRVDISYDTSGVYIVRLTVDDGSDRSHLDVYIHVENAPPTAQLRAPNRVLEDEEFTMDASGSNDSWPDSSGLQYRYSVDGQNITDWTESPMHNLSLGESGIYLLELYVRDPDGDTGKSSRMILVENQCPLSRIGGVEEAHEDEVVSFDGYLSSDTPSDLISLNYSWGVRELPLVKGYGAHLTTSFPRMGEYHVQLMVTDDDGEYNFSEHGVEVRNRPPIARIRAPGEALEDEVIHFDGSESMDTPSDLPYLNYSWDMDGDGSFDRYGREMSWSYPRQDRYRVTLRVTDDDGATSMDQWTVDVLNADPHPEIIGMDEGIEDELLEFRAGDDPDTPSDIGLIVYTWHVDGKRVLSGGEGLSFSFNTSGEHTVSLEAKDDQGAVGSFTQYVNIVNPVPVAVIGQVPDEVEAGDEIALVGSDSTDNPSDLASLRFRWILDGAILSGMDSENITIIIRDPGIHTIILEVEDDDGDVGRSDPATMTVLEKRERVNLLSLLLSIEGMMAMILILLLVIVAVSLWQKRMSSLPEPLNGMSEVGGADSPDHPSTDRVDSYGRSSDGGGEESPGAVASLDANPLEGREVDSPPSPGLSGNLPESALKIIGDLPEMTYDLAAPEMSPPEIGDIVIEPPDPTLLEPGIPEEAPPGGTADIHSEGHAVEGRPDDPV